MPNKDLQSMFNETKKIPAPAKTKSGAKPRASRAGTRSVAKLSEEQLARKRANDREAQRAIRQRTREHIKYLENRIKELSGDPESDPALKEAQQRNSELEEELRQLKEKLNDRTTNNLSNFPPYQPSTTQPADFPSFRPDAAQTWRGSLWMQTSFQQPPPQDQFHQPTQPAPAQFIPT